LIIYPNFIEEEKSGLFFSINLLDKNHKTIKIQLKILHPNTMEFLTQLQ